MVEIKFEIKKASFKQIWLTLFIPFVPLIFYDLVSTYYGVCIKNSFELSTFALWFVPKVGYLPACIFFFLVHAGINGVLALYIYVAKKHDIWLVFWLIVWSILLFNYAKVFLINTNSLIYMHTNKTLIHPQDVVKLVKLPEAEIRRRAAIFYKVKKDFCRLI